MKPSAPLTYKYIMEKNGQEEEFTEYPKDTTYKYKAMVPLNPEAGPKIIDFNIWSDAGDFTQEIFKGNKLIIIVQDVRKANHDKFPQINKLVSDAEKLGKDKITTVALTSSSAPDFELFRHEVNLATPYYFGDGTVLKTMMRANPGIMLLKNGVVVGKWHHNNTPDIAEVQELL